MSSDTWREVTHHLIAEVERLDREQMLCREDRAKIRSKQAFMLGAFAAAWSLLGVAIALLALLK